MCRATAVSIKTRGVVYGRRHNSCPQRKGAKDKSHSNRVALGRPSRRPEDSASEDSLVARVLPD